VEPFASSSLVSGDSEVLFHVEDVEPGFICNLMLVTNDFIDNDPALVQKLVEGAARSGLWAQNNLEQAAVIASEYWNQSLDIVRFALVKDPKRVQFGQFVPKESELQNLADRMVRLNMIESRDIRGCFK
jgi:NitT/TauT family transport system substrate-binding protein